VAKPDAAAGPAVPSGVELLVRIDDPGTVLAGRLMIEGQAPRAFAGWLELISALDDALDSLQRRARN
jgi:hypothetical protein